MRYYEPPQFDVKSLFVPDMTPWEQMIKMKEYEFDISKDIAEKKQAEHKANLANLDALNKGLVINSMPANQDILKRNELLTYYKNQISNIVDVFSNNPEDPRIPGSIAYLKNKWNTDLDRLTLEDNYKVYSENYLKDLSNANKEGAYLPQLDPYREYANNNTFGRWNYTGIENYKDPTDIKNTLMKDIQPSIFSSIKTSTKNGMITVDKENFEKVTLPMIRNVAKANINNYLTSIPGRQQYRLYLNQFDGDKDKAISALENDLFSIGYKQFRDNLKDKGISFHNLPDDYQGSSDSGYFQTPNTEIPKLNIDSSDFDYNTENYKIKSSPGFYMNVPTNVSTYTPTETGFKKFSDLQPKSQEFLKSVLYNMGKDDILKKLEKNEDLTEKEKEIYYKNVQEIIKDSEENPNKYNSTVIPLEIKKSEKENYRYFGIKNPTINDILNGTGNIINTEFYDKESGKKLTYKEFKEKLKRDYKDDEDAKKSQVSINGEFDYKNPYVFLGRNKNFTEAKQINIAGKEYIISGVEGYANQEEQINRKIKEAINAIYSVQFVPGNLKRLSLHGKDVQIGYNKDTKKYLLSETNDGNITAPEFDTPEQLSTYLIK